MDIQTIAAAAMAFLGPYLTKGGEEFANTVGKVAAEKVGVLYQTIKKKFKGDAYAEQTLTRAEEKPKSEGRQATLKEVLTEKLQEDTKFAEMVLQLVEESQQAPGGDVITQHLDISGEVEGDVFQIGKMEQ